MSRIAISSLALLLVGCGKSDAPIEPVAYQPPTRESAVEFALAMSEAEVAATEPESYRTWIIAHRTGVCEVHQLKMERRWVRVVYGLPDLSALPSQEEGAAFPYGDETWPGGCVVGSVKEEETYICTECVKNLRLWEETRKRKTAQPGATDNPDDAQRI